MQMGVEVPAIGWFLRSDRSGAGEMNYECRGAPNFGRDGKTELQNRDRGKNCEYKLLPTMQDLSVLQSATVLDRESVMLTKLLLNPITAQWCASSDLMRLTSLESSGAWNVVR